MLLFPRAENARAALLAHYSDQLTRCLDGIDGASLPAGDDPRTAVAVGAVFWLARRVDVQELRNKPAPSFDEIERARPRRARAAAAFSPTAAHRLTCAVRAAKLADVAAAASRSSRASSRCPAPGGEFIARVCGAPAASVVAEAPATCWI